MLVLGMGDGAITTLTIADLLKADTKQYLKHLPSRLRGMQGLELERAGKSELYLQNGNIYPSPYDFSIYTDYLKELAAVVPNDDEI